MKRLIISMLLIGTCFLSACSNAQNSNTDNATASGKSKSEATTADEAGYDPYSVENKYDIPDSYFEKKSGVDYGTVLKDVTYYSTTAGDNKQCNILLPAGYDESQTYPVMYIFHGFSGSHNNQIDTDSYVTLLYGNMLHDNLTVPMILVNVDMYTDKQADKESKTEEELRYSYDKAVDDVAVDLMPFIEKNYRGRSKVALYRLQVARQIRLYRLICSRYQRYSRRRQLYGQLLDGSVLSRRISTADSGYNTVLSLYDGRQRGSVEYSGNSALPRRFE